ncbi:hypothetical protein [Methylocapsa palsarum]|uniref:Uncharacterized protein n=1 Tax=Methylocapsa palsarum TaxID=1612308 RepID=A0A1I4B4T4_9HYPH|nr:hypothetical protein [Methylocapsa palsarum]SFK63724.1 hypothetical protein SAMN05444581_11320 [Methylocapsa palsarum]
MIDKIDGGYHATHNNHKKSCTTKPFPAWVQAMKHDEPSEDEDHKAAERRHWTIQNWAQCITVVVGSLALIGAFVSASLSYRAFKEAQRQANAAQEQVGIMREQERAWVSAAIVIDGDYTFLPYLGGTLRFHLTLKNVGHTPAFNTRTSIRLYAPQSKGDDIITTLKEACEHLRSQPDLLSVVLFPDEITRSDIFNPELSYMVTVDQIVNHIKISHNGDNISLFILGCVDYTINDEHHETSVLYSIYTVEKNTGAINGTISPYETIKREDIRVRAVYGHSSLTY